MIRPFAPTQKTLRFLRQLVYPRSSDVCVAFERCPRIHTPGRRPFSLAVALLSSPDVLGESSGVSGSPYGFTGSKCRPIPAKSTTPRSVISKKRLSTTSSPSQDSPLPYYRRWKRLVQSNLAVARKQFLAVRREHGLFAVQDVDKMARALMLALHRRGHFADVPRIFRHQLKLVGRPSSVHSLNLCLDAYKRSNRWSRVIELCGTWTKYAGGDKWKDWNFRSAKTHELYVRALMETGCLQEASNAIESLYSSPSTVAYYLRQMSKRLTSFDEFYVLFQSIMERQYKIQAPVKMYNIILEEALLARKTEIAQHYIKEMRDVSIKPNAGTFGAFLNMQTLVGDWKGVGKTLEQIFQKDLAVPHRNINNMVDAYARSHTVEELEDFFGALLSEGIRPSVTTFNSMIRETLQKGRFESMLNWATRMKEMGLEANAGTFELLYKAIGAAKLADEDVLLNRITKLVYSINKSLVSRRLTAPVETVFEENPLPDSSLDSERNQPGMHINDEYIVRKIKDAINRGKPEDAIRIFRDSFSLQRSRRVLHTLIAAYVSLPDDFDNARSDLRPLPTSTTQALQDTLTYHILSIIEDTISPDRPRGHTPRDTILYPYVFASYKLSAYHNIPLSHATTVSCAARLIDRSDPLAAVRLMNDISKTPFGTLAAWNIEAFTVLLRAYAELGDLRGICWVVGRIIDSGLLPDRRVQVYLGRTLLRGLGEEEVRIIEELKRRCTAAREEHQAKVRYVANEFIELVKDQAIGKVSKQPKRMGAVPRPRELKRLKDGVNKGQEQEVETVIRKVKVRKKFKVAFVKMQSMRERRKAGVPPAVERPERRMEQYIEGGLHYDREM